jgi:leucyl-tRNA synthetase
MDEGTRQSDPDDVTVRAGTPDAGVTAHRYDAKLANEIEFWWQDWWEANGTFLSPNPAGSLAAGFDQVAGRRKCYVLDMFPYPSGAGLHVGHPLGYIGTDVFARYLRMTGHHVLHTFGYDAFGLPAEQYAIDTGQHPAITTRNNIGNMRRQLRRLGLGHDPRREVATSDVSFYRWTQWIFLKIFNSWYDEGTGRARPVRDLEAELASGRRTAPDGRAWADLSELERRDVIDGHRLAYISEELVNWCPGLGTVLANEEVTADGRSDIGNYPVYRRPLRQWMLRITAFAERLFDDLDLVDWPESMKQMQRNWIGPSDGAYIDLPMQGGTGTAIRVFTTRPDTLPGATYVVLAPEHPLAGRLLPGSWPTGTPEAWTYPQGRPGAASWQPPDAVRAYQAMAARLSDRQRIAENYDKTGVFTGAYATNPATGKPMPVFLADYVLIGYGTGAIMAVPAHDQRDLEFAAEFGLDVRAVLRPPAAWFASHAIPDDTPARRWPEAFTGEGQYVSAFGSGAAGQSKDEAIEAAISWLEASGTGKRARSYRLRDWLFSRQRYWGEPFPIVYDDSGRPRALPEDMLPVTLPEMKDFRPEPQADEDSDPVPPLARAAGWAETVIDLGRGPRRYRRELNTMPQWAGSCWYYLRYLDPANDEAFVDPEVERYWMTLPEGTPGDGGVDLYVGGVEHAVLHLLYARFWHKVLYDLGYVSTKEPFWRLFNQGYILADAFTEARGMYVPAAEVTQHPDGTCAYQGQPVRRRAGKMGKSLKNSVSPDDIYARYGADTLRLYEMAMGPLDTDRPWRTDDIVGMYRFLQRLWRCLVSETTGEIRVSDDPLDEKTAHLLHRTIKEVRKDFGDLRFNTAIARLIELASHAARLAASAQALPRALAEPLVLMVAPLAPHIAEELWKRLGHQRSLAWATFPVADAALAAEEIIVLPVQVDGKTRFTLEVPAAAGEAEIRQILEHNASVARYTEGTPVRRLVIVPGKIVNIVLR